MIHAVSSSAPLDGIPGAIIATAAVLTALTVLATFLWKRLLRPVKRLCEEVAEFLSDWRGTDGDQVRGIPARKSVPERLSEIEHEVHTNSGGSLKDGVQRIERDVTALHVKADDNGVRIDRLNDSQVVLASNLDRLDEKHAELRLRVERRNIQGDAFLGVALPILRQHGIELPEPNRHRRDGDGDGD